MRAESGTVVWTDSLAASVAGGGVADFSAIRGLPVIADGRVYAIGMGGLMVAATFQPAGGCGSARWAARTSPWAAGDWLFIVSLNQQMAAISRDDGRVAWVTELPRWENPEKQKDPITWWGPLAGRRSPGGRRNQRNGAGGQSLYRRDSRAAEAVREAHRSVRSRRRHGCLRDHRRRQAAGLTLRMADASPGRHCRPAERRQIDAVQPARRPAAALVADTPGVTRDRKEAEAMLRGRLVRLVDTAGLEEAAPETLAGRMRAGAGTRWRRPTWCCSWSMRAPA